jgi:hypothetical protein
MKTNVLHGMGTGEMRLLFATEAYSMGTDVPDIRRIVHYGVPSTLESKIPFTSNKHCKMCNTPVTVLNTFEWAIT